MPNEIEQGSETPANVETPAAPALPPELSNIINQAITGHMKRFAEKTLPTMLQSAIGPLAEQLKAVQAAPAAPAKAEEQNRPDPQIAAMTAQLAELKKALADGEAQRKAIETKARDERAYGELKSSLAGQVRPELLDMLANDLFHMKKMVEFGDDGSYTFKGQKETIPGYFEDVSFPLKAGVEQWLKSDAAKAFLPAPATAQAQPVGNRRVVQPPKFGKDVDPAKLNNEGKNALAGDLESQFAAILNAKQ